MENVDLRSPLRSLSAEIFREAPEEVLLKDIGMIEKERKAF